MAGSLDLRVLDLAEFVVESYFSFCLEHPEYSIDVDYVSMLISCQREKTPELVSELFDRGLISRAEYAEILKGLILARIGISDQLIIMDRTLAANRSLDPSLNRSELIQEILRELKRSLNPAVFRDAVSPLRLFYIGTDIEEELQGTLSPRARTIITESLHKLVETMVDKGSTPVTLACSDEVVDQLTSLTEDTPGLRGRTRVFGYRQLASYKHVERLGLVQM
jgi:polyhydroxyalkanoate synthesis regulator phasin